MTYFSKGGGVDPARPFALKRTDAVEALRRTPASPAPYVRPCTACGGKIELVGGGRRCTACGEQEFPVGYEQAPP